MDYLDDLPADGNNGMCETGNGLTESEGAQATTYYRGDCDESFTNESFIQAVTPFWRCSSEEFSNFCLEDVEMLLIAVQTYGRIPDFTMEIIMKLLAALLPHDCDLKKISYDVLLSRVQR